MLLSLAKLGLLNDSFAFYGTDGSINLTSDCKLKFEFTLGILFKNSLTDEASLVCYYKTNLLWRGESLLILVILKINGESGYLVSSLSSKLGEF